MVRKTPSAKIIEDSNPDRCVTDNDGRKIYYRPLTILDQYKLCCAMGAERADNQAALRIATIAAMVTQIDGNPTPRATTPATVEAAIARLGDAGCAAMMLAAAKEMERAQAEASEAPEVPSDPLA